MDADLVPDDQSIAYVTNDPNSAYNGTWRKEGATGVGSWVQSSYDRVAVVEAEMNALFGEDAVGAPELVFTLVDGLGKAALGIKSDGTVLVSSMEAVSALFTALTVGTLNGATGDRISSAAEIVEEIADHQELAYVVNDVEGKTAFGIRHDGTIVGRNAEIDTLAVRILSLSKLQDLQDFTAVGGTVESLSATTLNGHAVVTDSRHGNGNNYQAEICHILSYGQSLGRGDSAGGIITTVQEFDNLMLNVGVRTYLTGDRTALVPLIESGGETPVSGTLAHIKALILAENALAYTDHTYELLGSAPAVGGQPLADLSKGGGSYYTNPLMLDIGSGYALAQADGKTYAVSAITMTQGEADYLLGTSKENYQTLFTQFVDDINTDIKAVTGQADDAKVITYQVSSHLKNSASTPTIALAQLDLAVADECRRLVMATPVYHLTYSDGLHLTAESYRWLGAYYGLAYKRVVIDQKDWYPLTPLSAFRQGFIAYIRFHVPVEPLVIDTLLVTDNTDAGSETLLGFQIFDGAANMALTSVAVTGPNTVKIVASTPIPAGAKIRYAHTGGVESGWNSGPRGNLRDSQGESLIFDPLGINKPMHNWCVIFETTLV